MKYIFIKFLRSCFSLTCMFLATSGIVLFSGCSTIFDSRRQKATLMEYYDAGDYQQAVEIVTDKADDRKDTGDELMWRLEEGSVKFAASDYQGSLKAFERAEAIVKNFDNRADISARDAGAEAGVIITNLNALPYKGYYYDKILLNTYKALDYFAMGKNSGAMVELRRMHEQQKLALKNFESEIREREEEIKKANSANAKKLKNNKGASQDASVDFDSLKGNKKVSEICQSLEAHSNKVYANFANPFATYLSAIGYLADNNCSEAFVDFKNLYKMESGNKLIIGDYVTLGSQLGMQMPNEIKNIKPYKYPLDKNIVFVIFANGLAPALKQFKLQIILPWVGYTGFSIPIMEYFPAPYHSLKITSPDGINTITVKIADMDAAFAQEFKQLFPMILVRTALSVVSKEIASFIAVQAAGRTGGLWAQIIAYIATGLYKYTFNTADTRCWQCLAKNYQIAHFPMPSSATVNISGLRSGGAPATVKIPVKLNNRKNLSIIYVKSAQNGKLSIKVFGDLNKINKIKD